MNIRFYSILIITVLLISACKKMEVVNTKLQELILSNGSVIKLPPDPGEAGKATLAGIDSDGDGVRDDIQRYIALTYPNSEKTRAALSQVAQSVQVELLDANDRQASISHAVVAMRDMECLIYIHGVESAGTLWAQLEAQFINTDERIRAYIKANAQASGQVFTSTPREQRRLTCNFDPDAMKD